MGKFKTRAVFFDIGSRSADFEITAARQICRAADVGLEVVDLTGLKHFFLGVTPEPQLAIGFLGAFKDGAGNCPHGLFGVASTYCVTAGIDVLVTGMRGEDNPGSAKMKHYLRTWGAAICDLQDVDFDFYFPLIEMSKAQVVEMGTKLGVPFELTRSCIEATRAPCGACKPCQDRERAFIEAAPG